MYALYFIIIAAISLAACYYELRALPLVVVSLPLFFKLKFGAAVYLHPTVLFLFCIMLGYAMKMFIRPRYYEMLKEAIARHTLIRANYLFLGLYFFYAGIGILRTQVFDAGLVLRFFLYGIGFSVLPLSILCGTRFTERKFRRFLYGLMGTSLAASLYSLYFIGTTIRSGKALLYGEYSLYHVALGTFGQYINNAGVHIIPKGAKTQFGLYLTIVIAIIFSLLISKQSMMKKWMLWIVFGINSLCIIFTASRLVWLVYFLSLMLLIYLKSSRFKKILLFSSLLVGTGMFIYLFPNNYVVMKLTHSFAISDGRLVFIGSAGERMQYWQECIRLTFKNVFFPFLGMGVIDLKQQHQVVAESLFLWFWVQMGVIGILVLSMIWHQIIRLLGALRQRFTDSCYVVSHLAMGVYVFAIGWLLDAVFAGGDFLDITLMVPFWGIVGLLVGYYRTQSVHSISE